MRKCKAGFSISAAAQRRLHALAFALRVPKSQIVECGIDYVVARLEAPERSAFQAACVASGIDGTDTGPPRRTPASGAKAERGASSPATKEAR